MFGWQGITLFTYDSGKKEEINAHNVETGNFRYY